MYFVANHAFRETRSFFSLLRASSPFRGVAKSYARAACERRMSVKQNMNQLQPYSVNTATEGAVASVPINGVSVLKGLC